MGDKTNPHEKACCNKENKLEEKKLVKATELPIHGNPFPPKDVIQNEKPGLIETKVRSARASLQPIIAPLASAYEKTNDIISIGYAHSQSSLQRLSENHNTVFKALLISGAGFLGFGLTRRRGIFKRLLLSSIFFTGAAAACYPDDAEQKAQVFWYIAKNKLPEVAKQQYVKLTQGYNSSQNQEKTETEQPDNKE